MKKNNPKKSEERESTKTKRGGRMKKSCKGE